MDTFRDLTTGREYPVGSVGELHRRLDRLVDELDNEGHHLAHHPNIDPAAMVEALDEVGHTCQQLARRLAVIGVRANTVRATAARQETA